MNRFFLIYMGLCLAVPGAFAQRPATQVNVSRPTTAVSVSRPNTAVTVSRPATSVSVSRPTTAVSVSRPDTAVSVSRPVTNVSVSRPATFVETPVAGGASAASSAGAALSKKAAPETPAAPASSAKTSMSGYKPPVAKDLKAAQTGGGAEGLGNKVNQAEKDASAAANQAPKGVDPSTVSAQDVMSGKTNPGLLNLLKQKAAGRSGSGTK